MRDPTAVDERLRAELATLRGDSADALGDSRVAQYNRGVAVSIESARRTAYIAVMRRRARAGSGSSLAFLRARRSIVVPDLMSLLAGQPFVVVGGVATSLYMPARHTDDLDILVTAADHARVEEALLASHAERLGPLALGGALGTKGFAWRLTDGTEVDVLVSGSRWARDAVAHPNRDAQGVPMIGFAHLVLMKLDAGRGVDVGDLGRMLGLADEAVLESTRQVVQSTLPEAIDDLESLIELGRLEVEAPRASPSDAPLL